METPRCDSCGRNDEPVVEVRRIYLTPAAWDTEAKSEPAATTEHWCQVCQLHYPHEAPDGPLNQP